MKKIPLTQGQFAIVDDEDYDFLMQWKWQASWNAKTRSFYPMRSIRVDGKKKRLIMSREIMKVDPDEQVDHIDRDTLNHHRENLRKATNRENQENRRKQSKYGTGVFKNTQWPLKKPYYVQIQVNKKRVCLGTFATIEEAQRERANAKMVFALAGCQ